MQVETGGVRWPQVIVGLSPNIVPSVCWCSVLWAELVSCWKNTFHNSTSFSCFKSRVHICCTYHSNLILPLKKTGSIILLYLHQSMTQLFIHVLVPCAQFSGFWTLLSTQYSSFWDLTLCFWGYFYLYCLTSLRYQLDGLGIDSRWSVTGDFSRSYRWNHVPWGQFSL
jgi:hypothetical protein